MDDIGDLKRPQMTSNDPKTNSNEPVKNKKNKLKGGSIQENIEINEHYLDKILKIMILGHLNVYDDNKLKYLYVYL